MATLQLPFATDKVYDSQNHVLYHQNILTQKVQCPSTTSAYPIFFKECNRHLSFASDMVFFCHIQSWIHFVQGRQVTSFRAVNRQDWFHIFCWDYEIYGDITCVDISNYEANSDQTGKQIASPAQPSVAGATMNKFQAPLIEKTHPIINNHLHWGHHEHVSSLMPYFLRASGQIVSIHQFNKRCSPAQNHLREPG